MSINYDMRTGMDGDAQNPTLLRGKVFNASAKHKQRVCHILWIGHTLYMFCNLKFDYASAITPVGQVPAHAPHEMQLSASISNLPSPSLIAPTGQAPAHAPQDTHPSLITYAIIFSSLNMSF